MKSGPRCRSLHTVTSEGVRQLPAGAEVVPDGVHFRVWAPDHGSVDVVFDRESIRPVPLQREADGYFSAFAPGIQAGTRVKAGDMLELV